ncbi:MULTISPECIES: CBS domain-containing protein [unclassified Guyparkeria]|uniref:CBS domain-containing protein n=1 Tax=unclassified Guyparkeria TaxID=2626246 RepID=UPI0012E3D31E|nr:MULTISPECIES: CBS domain-containing protein [unclassified Guyparkeria]
MEGIPRIWEKIKTLCLAHEGLSIASGVSAVLLIVFLFFQSLFPRTLDLDGKWLIVAAVPLILALVVGGYVKKLKGFGVELEANLHKPVGASALLATHAIEPSVSDIKGDISYLHRISGRRRNIIDRLLVVEGRSNFYSVDAFQEYLYHLPNLRYLEVRDSSDDFVALIPLRRLLGRTITKYKVHDSDSSRIEEFLSVLQDRAVLARYASSAITEYVKAEMPLIEALRHMHTHRLEVVAVLDENGKTVGVLERRRVERDVVQMVLSQDQS